MNTTIQVILAIAAMILIGTLYMRSVGSSLSSADAHKLVREGARLIDVRTREEFAQGHLPDALNVPVQELRARLSELPPKDQVVVLYCRSGARSGQAASLLRGEGFSAVHDLGAMSRW
jgi:phage shock protein E